MARVNDNYLKLAAGYLFPEISRRMDVFTSANPDADVIKLGIGDVVLPLGGAVRQAMHDAIDEMATADGFRGYGPSEGYDFLREAIAENDFGSRGVKIDPSEIYASDGSKCDSANIQEIFADDCSLAVSDPVYPVYVDTNVMAGRTGAAGEDGRYDGILYLPATEENGFMPAPPSTRVDIAYLCSPNNPTGAVASRENLEAWVAWARSEDAVLAGVEGSFDWAFVDAVKLDGTASYVRGTITETEEPLPLIPPLQGRLGIEYQPQTWFLRGETTWAAKQDRVGEFEEPTAGYVVLGVSGGVRLTVGGRLHVITASLTNLTDVEYRNPLSRVKEIMPEAGRGLSLSYRVVF